MDALIILALLIGLAILSVRYGADGRGEERFLAKECQLAAYGVTWDHVAQPGLQPPRPAAPARVGTPPSRLNRPQRNGGAISQGVPPLRLPGRGFAAALGRGGAASCSTHADGAVLW